MFKKKVFLLLIAILLINPIFTNAFGNKYQFRIVNQTKKTVSYEEIEKAYNSTYEKYSKVVSENLLKKISPEKIDTIYIVENVSHPEISEAGLTIAIVDPETKELQNLTIEVKADYRKGFQHMSFKYLIEHELGHAFAFMMQLPQAQEIGHKIQIEQLKNVNEVESKIVP